MKRLHPTALIVSHKYFDDLLKNPKKMKPFHNYVRRIKTRMEGLKRRSAFTIIEVLVVIAIIAIIGTALYAGYYVERVQMPESYQAWVKQTGNPNKLTFREWRALVRAYRHSDDSTTYIPMPQ